jgi:DnaJ-class molecular chaperone
MIHSAEWDMCSTTRACGACGGSGRVRRRKCGACGGGGGDVSHPQIDAIRSAALAAM